MAPSWLSTTNALSLDEALTAQIIGCYAVVMPGTANQSQHVLALTLLNEHCVANHARKHADQLVFVPHLPIRYMDIFCKDRNTCKKKLQTEVGMGIMFTSSFHDAKEGHARAQYAGYT